MGLVNPINDEVSGAKEGKGKQAFISNKKKMELILYIFLICMTFQKEIDCVGPGQVT